MLSLFAAKAVPNEVVHIVQSLDRLKERISSGVYANPRLEFGKCGDSFKAVREYAVDLDDEILADSSYVFMRYFKLFSDLADYFSLLDEGAFADSWIRLQDCLDGIGLVLRFVGKEYSCELPQLRLLLEAYESLYPYTYFTSPEYLVLESHCSICGRSMQNLDCPHRKEHLYGGQLANEVIDKAKILAIAVVKHPKDKRCVITTTDSSDVHFDKLEKFLALGLPRLRRFSINERAFLEEGPNTVKTGDDQPCNCGSDPKFKRRCGNNPYRERLDCRVAVGGIVKLHLFCA